MMSSSRLRHTLTVVAFVLATRVDAREPYDVTIENNVKMKTRDGVTLGADIYRPNADGILRARYRNSMEKAEFMNPGEIYKLTINLWSTSNVFLAGHKLRVEVSSSNFRRFDRNLNTGEDPESGTRMIKASNLVYHDREHPSALVVPVVP